MSKPAPATRKFEPTQEETTTVNLLQQWKLIIGLILAVIAWWLFRGYTAPVTGVFSGDSLFLMFVALIGGGKAFVWQAKINSPAVIWNSGNSTFDGAVDRIGDWRIIRLGGMWWGPWRWPGNEGSIIFHKSAGLRRGKSVDVAIRGLTIEFAELPPTVRRAFAERGYPQPIIFGMADESILTQMPNLEPMINDYLAQNKRIYELEKDVEGQQDYNEKMRNWQERMDIRSPSVGDKVKGLFKKEEY